MSYTDVFIHIEGIGNRLYRRQNDPDHFGPEFATLLEDQPSEPGAALYRVAPTASGQPPQRVTLPYTGPYYD